MKQAQWWTPGPKGTNGTMLSRRWVQTFVFELPDLNQSELKSSLRYKVQATLPVDTEQFEFHTQLFRYNKKKYGAAFLVPSALLPDLPRPARGLRVGVPLLLPPTVSRQVLLFISNPEGLSPHLYENRILKTSFAPLEWRDQAMRMRLIEQFPEAQVLGFSPDPEHPLPPDLREKSMPESLRTRLLKALPSWDPPPPSRLPALAGALLLISGVVLAGSALENGWSVREQRNETWRLWLKQNEAQSMATASQDKRALWIKSQGAPVPELFVHLANVWGDQTKILDLEWTQGKLTLTAESSSALTSLRNLTSDPWFHNIRVDDIRTQKNGREVFTVEGGLVLDQ